MSHHVNLLLKDIMESNIPQNQAHGDPFFNTAEVKTINNNYLVPQLPAASS